MAVAAAAAVLAVRLVAYSTPAADLSAAGLYSFAMALKFAATAAVAAIEFETEMMCAMPAMIVSWINRLAMNWFQLSLMWGANW